MQGTEQLKGRIKMTSTKGYGFITGDDGRDYFFHASTVQVVDGKSKAAARGRNELFEMLHDGDRVVFEVEEQDAQAEARRQATAPRGTVMGPRATWVER